MSLYKRKDSPFWWVKISRQGHCPLQESTGTANKRQAREYHDRRRAEVWEQHRLGVKPRRKWEEAVLRYLEESADKPGIVTFRFHLRWMQPHLEGMDLTEIDRDVVERIIQTGLREGVTNTTVNRRVQVLRAILRRAAHEWEWLDKVPRFRMLNEPQGRVRFLTRQEAMRLLTELPEHLRAMARFSLATGLRQGNVKRLRWAQVDRERRRAWILAEEAKARRAISVPLNAEAMQVIEEQIGRHPEFVFTFQGEPVTQISTKAWRSAVKRAGIENFRWHDLRHTWASWHAQNGTPMNVLQELGGWRTSEMVQRYAHLSMEHLERYAEQARLSELAIGYDLATLEKETAPKGRLTH
ncbi:tyrosine-type recombinase/integrase [Solimonas terrae]|uniref:Tyrosine-type recombinase/integrase n=1 Tax=Solimonas terrae TaxID=1396819 RepID=A0A6M2BSZ3_9GAMM|nr:site-specific integrase [Solimonas terrae]NGY05351.1 tyrosine-type recombinase/integrase [Solimonas terrae]